MVEVSTTKVSSKGQVVIPKNVRKAAGLKEGEKLLAIAIDNTVVLKKIVDKNFEDTVKHIWKKVKQLGLTEEDVNVLIEEAKNSRCLDTNVWISAMIRGGRPAEIINAAENGQISIMISEEIVEEINRILAYQRISEIYEPAGLNRQELIGAVFSVGKIVQVTNKVSVVREDPSDDKFIECAIAAEAKFIVGGYKHLLKMEKYGKIRIFSVSEFIKTLKANS